MKETEQLNHSIPAENIEGKPMSWLEKKRRQLITDQQLQSRVLGIYQFETKQVTKEVQSP